MDILEIRNQRLSTLLADFNICESCKIVDRNRNRMEVGYRCPRCGAAGRGGTLYFSLSVFSLIDLMQDFYHLNQEAVSHSEDLTDQNKSDHRLAVVIFYCTLAEVLLLHFLEQCMFEMGVPNQIQERLLDDNPFVNQRVEKLFPTLTGIKWNKAVELLEEGTDLNYAETVAFSKRASIARNDFLHRGNKYAIPQDMPEQCIRHIRPLVSLFVALHNEYVARPVGNHGLQPKGGGMKT